ncbi:MAG: CHAP domain-containing protein [Solirubrobacterales bacterium]
MSRACAVVAAVGAVFAFGGASALAGTTKDAAARYGYPYPSAPDCYEPGGSGGACAEDQWHFFQGQCTSWVAHRLSTRSGVSFSNSYKKQRWSNATNWKTVAKRLGITVNKTPAVGAIAWYSKGHVAYVEEITPKVVISEMNYDYKNGFQRIAVSPGGRSWPTEFIHIKDLKSGSWYQRNYNSSGASAASFSYGQAGDRPIAGNWDGVGGDTVGVFRSGTWYLRNYNSSGSSNASFSFGKSTDIPVVGDWNGDGKDTIGVFRSGIWYLRNSNSSGRADITFSYGKSTDVPIAGNWDGVGGDTVGVFRSGTWYLRNYNSSGSSNASFSYGKSTDVPIVGNWDGVGGDTVGVFRLGTWYERNYNSSGPSSSPFGYGRLADRPVVGDWDGYIGDTVAVFRP